MMLDTSRIDHKGQYLLSIISLLWTCFACSAAQSNEFGSPKWEKASLRCSAISHNMRGKLGMNLRGIGIRLIQRANPFPKMALESVSGGSVIPVNGEKVRSESGDEASREESGYGRYSFGVHYFIGSIVGLNKARFCHSEYQLCVAAPQDSKLRVCEPVRTIHNLWQSSQPDNRRKYSQSQMLRGRRRSRTQTRSKRSNQTRRSHSARDKAVSRGQAKAAIPCARRAGHPTLGSHSTDRQTCAL
jgi:hypothetical protein